MNSLSSVVFSCVRECVCVSVCQSLIAQNIELWNVPNRIYKYLRLKCRSTSIRVNELRCEWALLNLTERSLNVENMWMTAKWIQAHFHLIFLSPFHWEFNIKLAFRPNFRYKTEPVVFFGFVLHFSVITCYV